MVHEPVVKAEVDVEPTVIAPVVVLEIDDEDIDEDKEPEMDPEELDYMEEGIDAVAPGLALAANIAQIAAIWATEMATQLDGFVIGEKELVEAIAMAEALVATVEAVDDEIDDDIVVAEATDDELDKDDEDIDGDDALMDDNEEIAADLPEEMIFGSDDDIPPYESN